MAVDETPHHTSTAALLDGFATGDPDEVLRIGDAEVEIVAEVGPVARGEVSEGFGGLVGSSGPMLSSAAIAWLGTSYALTALRTSTATANAGAVRVPSPTAVQSCLPWRWRLLAMTACTSSHSFWSTSV